MARKQKRPSSAPRRSGNQSPPLPSGFPPLYRGLGIAFGVLAIAGLAIVAWQAWRDASPSQARFTSQTEDSSPVPANALEDSPRFFAFHNLILKWDELNENSLRRLKATSAKSNIRPTQYVGPQSCQNCHQENFAQWRGHSHRRMNELATEETVEGDFSGQAEIAYRGGRGTFYRVGEEFRMRFERDALVREYKITQTIGARFYQYYVGVGLQGPEPDDHDFYHVNFVLPFGFWLDRQAWVPVVHIFTEASEDKRWDPVESLTPPQSSEEEIEEVGTARGVIDHSQQVAAIYARSCNFCHTTFSVGDMMVRNPKRIGPALPEKHLLDLNDYISDVQPQLWNGQEAPETLSTDDLKQVIDAFVGMDARQYAADLGITCEACHLGCATHVSDEKVKPAFTPEDPHLFIDISSSHPQGRTQQNLNAICARCHAGNRPTYAAGMATWNSTEHTDAMRGSCYSELSCVGCHDPHQATGKAWTKSAEQDDQSCLACHEKYTQANARLAHTHHPAGTAGDRCMNCHMPKINEGMQDVVRTHAIFSPTEPNMLANNQPNACNLCHLEKSIEWTLSYLEQWYGRFYDRNQIYPQYPSRETPVGLGWLSGDHQPTRLVAAEAFATAGAGWALPQLIDLLDDPYLLNRQFVQKSIETLSGKQLDREFGYWYYMTPAERRPKIDAIRRQLLDSMPSN